MRASSELKAEEDSLSHSEKIRQEIHELDIDNRYEFCRIHRSIVRLVSHLAKSDANSALAILGSDVKYQVDHTNGDLFYYRICKTIRLTPESIIPKEDNLEVNPLMLSPPIKSNKKLFLDPEKKQLSDTPHKVTWKNDLVYLQDGVNLHKNGSMMRLETKILNQKTIKEHRISDDFKLDLTLNFDHGGTFPFPNTAEIFAENEREKTEIDMENVMDRVGKIISKIPSDIAIGIANDTKSFLMNLFCIAGILGGFLNYPFMAYYIIWGRRKGRKRSTKAALVNQWKKKNIETQRKTEKSPKRST